MASQSTSPGASNRLEPEEEEMQARRLRVERERLALEEDELRVKRMKLDGERSRLLQASSSILRLNVGGQSFDTTRETLLGASSSFFERLIGTQDDGLGLSGAAVDRDGRLFIDRSPEGFRLVLEWLRGNTDCDSLDRATRELLLKEAVYYDLPRLVRELHGGYDHTLLPVADQEIRARAHAARTALAEGAPGAAAAADEELERVFSGPNASGQTACALTYEATPVLPGCPLLFNADASRMRRTASKMCRSDAEFRASFESFAGPLLAGLDMTNLVVAGGAVVEAIGMRDAAGDVNASRATMSKADIDLFIVCEDELTARYMPHAPRG
jgi:hypothetical protein